MINLKRWDIFKLLRKANAINDINNNIILPKSLWETITIIKIDKNINILESFIKIISNNKTGQPNEKEQS